MIPPFDRVYGGVPRFAAEAPWSRRLALRLLRRVAAAREIDRFGTPPRVADAGGGSPIVFVCADPEALVPPAAQERLVAALAAAGPGTAAMFPVSNESDLVALRRPPGFAYASLSELEAFAQEAAASPSAVSILDLRGAPGPFPVYAVRRPALADAEADTPLAELPAALARAGRGL